MASIRQRMLACVIIAGLAVFAGAVIGLAQSATQPGTPVAADRETAIAEYRRARELVGQNKLVEAKEANDAALRVDPTFQDARIYEQVIAKRMADAGITPTTGGSSKAVKSEMLTPAQISRIRLWELNEKETISGSVDRKVLDELWQVIVKENAGPQLTETDRIRFFNAANFSNQVRRIRDTRDERFISKVNLTTDPKAMAVFRDRIQPFVLQSCANTIGCHGADNQPRSNFRLFRNSTPAGYYTNFYLMTQYRTSDGAMMIDRQRPGESLFLQYTMPKTLAKFQHPGNANVPVQFPKIDTKRFQDMTSWVTALNSIEPPYGIAYTPAWAPAATPATATAPATSTAPAP